MSASLAFEARPDALCTFYLDVLEAGLARMQGRPRHLNQSEQDHIKVLLAVDQHPTKEEAAAVVSFAGFVPRREISMKTAPGLPTTLIASRFAGLSARGSCLPQAELHRLAMASVRASARRRDLARRFAKWIHGAFLLEGGRFAPSLTSPVALWLLLTTELHAKVWRGIGGVDALRTFAGIEAMTVAVDAPPLSFVDQLVICEFARAVTRQDALSEDAPLVLAPLAAHPRYGLVDAPVDVPTVLQDFAPYFSSFEKAVSA